MPGRIETEGGLVIQGLEIWTVEMTVPDLGKYMFTTKGFDDFEVTYVQTITFTPN
jgi:hypothetical protein